MHKLGLIPRARRDAVRTALRATFGASAVGDFQPIRGGVSGALICRFDVHERTYVLRIEPERVAVRDRQRGIACMVAAASAGAAPPVHYHDPTTGVIIMDFVSGRPLSKHPGGPVGMVRALGALIARVQATPPFPILGDYKEVIGSMLTGLSRSSFFEPGQLDPHVEGFARICAALSWDTSSLVSRHNDPNPRNILFDGERVWLIDWELAFRNDPLVDVAILTTEFAETPELEDALLEFPGCVMVISHDRWFLDRIATHILSFEGDSHVEFFQGNYREYEEDKRRRLGEEGAQPHRLRFKALK